MNKILIAFVSIALIVFTAGCLEPFVGGFVAGVGAAETLAQQKQQEFNEAMERLNAEKEEIDAVIAQIEDADVKAYLQSLLDEQTLAYIEQLRSADWDDPKVITGYGLALLSALTAGYQKYKRQVEK